MDEGCSIIFGDCSPPKLILESSDCVFMEDDSGVSKFISGTWKSLTTYSSSRFRFKTRVSFGVDGGLGVSSFLSVCLELVMSEFIGLISLPTKEKVFTVGEIEKGNALSVGEGVSSGKNVGEVPEKQAGVLGPDGFAKKGLPGMVSLSMLALWGVVMVGVRP